MAESTIEQQVVALLTTREVGDDLAALGLISEAYRAGELPQVTALLVSTCFGAIKVAAKELDMSTAEILALLGRNAL